MPLIRRLRKAVQNPDKARNFVSKTASEYRYLLSQRAYLKLCSKTVAGAIGYHPFLEWLKQKNGRYATLPVRTFQMTLDLEDRSVGSDLAVYGNREVTLANRYEELLVERHPDTILDIGSNIGYYVLLAGNTGNTDIHAFEPEPANIELLRQNIELNNLTAQVTTNQSAVSDTDGTIMLGIESSSNSHSIKKTGGDTMEVNSITIDAYCRQHDLESVDVIRMDVEGAEISALAGMSTVIETSSPEILFIELHPWLLSEDKMATFVSLLQRYGYTLDLVISEGIISTPWPGSYDVSEADELLSIEGGVGVIATLGG